VSGGSFNYLYRRPDLGEVGPRDDYRDMADVLADAGHQGAATATRRVCSLLDEAMRIAAELSDIHHAVEWWRSGDYGEEHVKRAVVRWEKVVNPAEEKP